MVELSEISVGIDLGTTCSRLAVWRNGAPELIPNGKGNFSTPACVAFTTSGVLIGESAVVQAHKDPSTAVFDAKRLAGRWFSDAEVQSDRKLWPFRVSPASGDKTCIETTAAGTFAPPEILAMQIRKLKEIAEFYLCARIKNAVISVPACFTDAQRTAVKIAGIIAGLGVLTLISEPSAAIIATGLQGSQPGERDVVVLHCGAGTLEASVFVVEDTIFEERATCGNSHLGGEDLDQLLVSYVAAEVKAKTGAALPETAETRYRLTRECEKAKCELSTQPQASIKVAGVVPGHGLEEILITREKLGSICATFLSHCSATLNEVLRDAGMKRDQIHEVVLTGGTTKMPMLQARVREYFGTKTTISVATEEAVAIGAAVRAAVICSGADKKLADFLIISAISHSVGIELPDGRMSVLIPRNTLLPCRKERIFNTEKDNQCEIRFRVFEGERQMAKDNNLLGSFEEYDIYPAPRGCVRAATTFAVDPSGILTVTVEDKNTAILWRIRVRDDRNSLNRAEVQRMMEGLQARLQVPARKKQEPEAKAIPEEETKLSRKENPGASECHTKVQTMIQPEEKAEPQSGSKPEPKPSRSMPDKAGSKLDDVD